jgi:thiosulfate/3-mercaptopyruvate sulfurtransferase
VKKTILAVLTVLITIVFTGCANYDFAPTEQYIVTPDEALKLVEEGAILVDAQSSEEYGLSHIEGAVNIPMAALTISEPYSNMLPEKEQVEQVMSAAGLTENDTILVYDNQSNMQAARIQWTLNMFSNTNIKVVSGGLVALKEADAKATAEATTLEATTYTAGEMQKKLIVNLDYVKAQINNPDENTVIIDTRSTEEYYEGTIPGSVHIEYVLNNYATGEYKSPRDIQLTYLDEGLLPDTKIILFCKTSVRAAQTYTALKDAGFKDVRVYDGAWLEYSDVEQPLTPTTNAPPVQGDAS